jgi:hypothetical protein
MPGKATAAPPRTAPFHGAAERAFLSRLQAQALTYFLDNQAASGLVLDRQRNFGPRRARGLLSTAATGMGLIALGLASAPPHRLLTRAEAVARSRRAVETALERLPHTGGALPHFVTRGGAAAGPDARSTVDTAWFVAGALWAGEFLGDAPLRASADRLFARIDWRFWTAPSGLVCHGAGVEGRPLPWCWDRLNGETVFLYVLAAGAHPARAWPAENWRRLGAFRGEAGGLSFRSADLGLFVFQYGLDLLDLGGWRLPGAGDLLAEAGLAAEANARTCQEAARRFVTYRRFWGLSAGDGPGDRPGRDVYRPYAPAGPLDGTAHVTATVASLAHRPALVWENLSQADGERAWPLRGRYGFSNVNLDRGWVGRDVVGIDAGAAVLALDNCLAEGRVRHTFHRLRAVQRGLARLGATTARRGAA